MSQAFSVSERKPRSNRILLWVGISLIGLVALCATAFVVMSMRMNSVPADLDTSTTRVSDQGLYTVSYTPSNGVIPINQIHQWTLHVEDAGGQPVEGAEILIDGDMPQHGHGLPTQPRVTQELGNGDYQVEGLKFQMGGWWVMDFTITAAGQQDVVRFNMQLKN